MEFRLPSFDTTLQVSQTSSASHRNLPCETYLRHLRVSEGNALPYLGTTFPSAKTRSLRREGLFFFSFCLTILSTITYHPQHTKPPQQARTFPYRPSSRPGKEFGLPLLRVRGIANPTHDRPRYSNNGTIYWLGYVLIDPLSAREMAE